MSLNETILALVGNEKIPDQATLRKRLRQAGYELTQPTLSRHLKRLSVRKERGIYRHVEWPEAGIHGFTLTPVVPNLILLRTHPGFAQVLAITLDSEKVPGVAGTIAGDDTVFIATTETDLQALSSRIKEVLDTRTR